MCTLVKPPIFYEVAIMGLKEWLWFSWNCNCRIKGDNMACGTSMSRRRTVHNSWTWISIRKEAKGRANNRKKAEGRLSAEEAEGPAEDEGKNILLIGLIFKKAQTYDKFNDGRSTEHNFQEQFCKKKKSFICHRSKGVVDSTSIEVIVSLFLGSKISWQ